jgi:hypothetical protein
MSTILAILAVLGLCAVGMAITQAENRISATQLVKHFVAAPDATTLQTVTPWFDLSTFECFLVSYVKTTGTGAVSAFQIVANNESNGGGTTVTVIADAFAAGTVDAAGDQTFIECTAQQVARLASDNAVPLRYVAVQYQQATAGDTGVVTLVATGPRYAAPGLTADSIS